MKKTFSFLFVLLSLVCIIPSAWGRAHISVWPVKVALWPDSKTNEVRLENKGSEVVNMQVHARTWDMDEQGKFIETDTGDFVFFPRLVTIAPGAATTVRVGYKGDFPRLEKSYRLYFQELAPVTPPEQASEDIQSGVLVLLKLSLPLFVRPTQEITPPVPEVALLGSSDKGLRLMVKNRGVHHFGVLRTNVELHNGKKAVSSEEHTQFFRVLPEGQMVHEVPVNLDSCAKADSVRITLFFDSAEKNSFVQLLPLAKNCMPAVVQ